MAKIIVIGLGPAGPELVTVEALAAISATPTRFARTARHPAVSVLGEEAGSFDALYERHDTFAAVYDAIVEELLSVAEQGDGAVLYAVPGSPAVAERTVELLRERAPERGVALEIQTALSFLDLAWNRLGIDPLAAGVRMIDGHRFASQAAGDRGPLLVTQCHSREVLSDIKLALDGPGPDVIVLQRLGLGDESVHEVPWAALDREVNADHLTSVYIPQLVAPVANELVRMEGLMRTLRAGCPWDREQTHASLARYAIEEAYEVVEAIDALGDPVAADPDSAAIDHFQDELGDLLLQVIFHACIGAENGWFTLADIAAAQHDKLVHRHPWVFPREDFDGAVASADDAVSNWDLVKGRSFEDDPMAGLPGIAPALTYAVKVLKRAGAHPLPAADDLGSTLLALVAEARAGDPEVDPEVALRAAAARLRDEVRAHRSATPTAT